MLAYLVLVFANIKKTGIMSRVLLPVVVLLACRPCHGKPVARRMSDKELERQRDLSRALYNDKDGSTMFNDQLTSLSHGGAGARAPSPYTIDDPELAAQQLGGGQYATPQFAFKHNDDDALGPAYEKPPPLPARKKTQRLGGLWRKLTGD